MSYHVGRSTMRRGGTSSRHTVTVHLRMSIISPAPLVDVEDPAQGLSVRATGVYDTPQIGSTSGRSRLSLSIYLSSTIYLSLSIYLSSTLALCLRNDTTLLAPGFLGLNTRRKRSTVTLSASGSCCSFTDRVSLMRVR
jgi:hypothetical protein